MYKIKLTKEQIEDLNKLNKEILDKFKIKENLRNKQKELDEYIKTCDKLIKSKTNFIDELLNNNLNKTEFKKVFDYYINTLEKNQV